MFGIPADSCLVSRDGRCMTSRCGSDRLRTACGGRNGLCTFGFCVRRGLGRTVVGTDSGAALATCGSERGRCGGPSNAGAKGCGFMRRGTACMRVGTEVGVGARSRSKVEATSMECVVRLKKNAGSFAGFGDRHGGGCVCGIAVGSMRDVVMRMRSNRSSPGTHPKIRNSMMSTAADVCALSTRCGYFGVKFACRSIMRGLSFVVRSPFTTSTICDMGKGVKTLSGAPRRGNSCG